MLVLLDIDDYMYKTCPPQPLGLSTETLVTAHGKENMQRWSDNRDQV